jgi:DNA-binding response OmpR family regulator
VNGQKGDLKEQGIMRKPTDLMVLVTLLAYGLEDASQGRLMNDHQLGGCTRLITAVRNRYFVAGRGSTMKLLIVDTDRDLVEMLTGWLKTLGYEVYRAYTGERAKIEWEEQQPDLVLLDTTLKDVDALAMCRDMRHKHDALVFVLTDGKDVHDEVRCLESGADDYLRKPFFPTQLLARIHALNRRGRSTLAQRPSSIITVGPMRVDSLHNEVLVDGREAHLTPTESRILHLLAVNANNVCTASQIVAHIWGFGNDGDTCLIKAHIRHLRQKVEPDPGKPTHILTVPGVGYTLIRHTSEETKYSSKELTRTLRAVSV